MERREEIHEMTCRSNDFMIQVSMNLIMGYERGKPMGLLLFIIVIIALGVVAMKGARKRTERRREAINHFTDLLNMPEDEFQAYKDSVNQKSNNNQ